MYLYFILIWKLDVISFIHLNNDTRYVCTYFIGTSCGCLFLLVTKFLQIDYLKLSNENNDNKRR